MENSPPYNEERPPTIRELYPHFTEEQLAEAEQNLKRYAEIVLRICDSLDAQTNEGIGPLTAPTPDSKMESQRSIPHSE